MCDVIVLIGVLQYPETQFQQLRRVYGTSGLCPVIQSQRNAQDTKVLEVWYV